MQLSLLSVVVLLQIAPLPREPDQPAPDSQRPPRGTPFRAIQEKALKLVETTKSLGNWDEQAALGRAALEKVFQRSGWDSEADTFALEMVRAVDAIPPWEFERRGETFFSMLGERYGLSDEQRGTLQGLVVREAFQVFARNSESILTYASEAVQTRAAGEPFTAENVARWARLVEPVMRDAQESAKRVVAEITPALDEEQRERLRTDIAAADRRYGDISRQVERWKDGQWDPADWGMEDDPIQTGKGLAAREQNGPEAIAVEGELRRSVLAQREAQERVMALDAARRNAEESGDIGEAQRLAREAEMIRALAHRQEQDARDAAQRAAAARGAGSDGGGAPGASGAGEPAATGNENAAPDARPAEPPKRDAQVRKGDSNDPWVRFVEAYIRKYSLDDTQQQRAWLIHDESKQRADAVRTKAAARAESAAAKSDAASDEKKMAGLVEVATASQKELDRLFTQMKGRLEKIPTRAQRKNAAPGDLPDPTAVRSEKPVPRPARPAPSDEKKP